MLITIIIMMIATPRTIIIKKHNIYIIIYIIIYIQYIYINIYINISLSIDPPPFQKKYLNTFSPSPDPDHTPENSHFKTPDFIQMANVLQHIWRFPYIIFRKGYPQSSPWLSMSDWEDFWGTPGPDFP